MRGLFKKKKPETLSSIEATAAEIHRELKESNPDNRNFVDDLVDYFQSRKEVSEAYFGYLMNEQTKEYSLFLAVGHTGALADIRNLCWFLKSVHYPESAIQFASGEADANLYALIKNQSFPFYLKDTQTVLEQKIMKQWFEEDKFKEEFLAALPGCRLTGLIRQTDGAVTTIRFQVYEKPGQDFIPVFSSRQMMGPSGMDELPPGLELIEFNWAERHKALGLAAGPHHFMLNPATPFEVEFSN